MYKCDMCYDLIQNHKEPACVSACPKQALLSVLKKICKAMPGSGPKKIQDIYMVWKKMAAPQPYIYLPFL